MPLAFSRWPLIGPYNMYNATLRHMPAASSLACRLIALPCALSILYSLWDRLSLLRPTRRGQTPSTRDILIPDETIHTAASYRRTLQNLYLPRRIASYRHTMG
jgi:hypothetical protein